MFESVTDEECRNISSLCVDLSNLVTWAHTHGTICNQIPALKIVQNMGQPIKDNSVLWICGVGHAYHWTCENLHFRNIEENEAVEKRKKRTFSEASSQDATLDEKRIRATSSFEWARGDAATTGSCSPSRGVSQQKDLVYMIHNELLPRENQKSSKSMKSRSAAEQHLSTSRGEIKPDLHTVKLESSEDPQIISDDEQCILNAQNQGERINQNILLESPPKGVTVEVDLQMHYDQETEVNKQPVTPTSGFTLTEKLPTTPSCILKSLGSDQKILESSFLRLSPPNPAEFISKTSRARNSSGSATPKNFKLIPISDIEAKAQREPPPSVTFFEFEATADVQQIHLSSSECSTSGTDFSGHAAENPVEESRQSGAEHAPHPSTSLSPESRSSDHPREPSNKNVSRKRNRSATDIKVFRDWLGLHCPSETREIYKLPPTDLNNYLASFYSSAKKQNGMDFSAGTLYFFQTSIDRYLRDHNYEYSVVKGFEFRTSQEVLKQKLQHQSQKEREGEWTILENLTDENVDHLREKGLLSQTDPQGFLHLLFINIIRGFGASTHSQRQNLYWGQLVLRKDEAGLEHLEWKSDLGAGETTGESTPYLFASPDNPDNCPVQVYKKYAEKRPGDMLHDYDPLYLSPKRMYSMWDQVWYSRKSLTRNKIEQMLKVITQQIKRSEKTPRK